MQSTMWRELATIGLLIWMGYLGARLLRRVNLPAVVGFLLVGVALGPHGVGLLSLDLMHKIEFAEPLALGLIVFLIGERLTTRALTAHHWSFWALVILSVALPATAIALAAGWLAPEQPRYAWLLATIGLSGAPATLLACFGELKRRGRYCDMLVGSAALDNVVSVVAYAVVVPYLLWTMNVHTSVGAAIWQTARELGGAALVGLIAGLILAALTERVHDDGELLALGLVSVLLVVAFARTVEASGLLATLVAGVTVASVEERRMGEKRLFDSLKTVEYPVYVIFFTLAGAGLEPQAALAGGALAGAYIAARSVGRLAAGFGAGLMSGLSPQRAGWLGVALLPQAGVAVGLALNAGLTFPEVGPTVTAVVLSAIVVFELIGPVMLHRSVDVLCASDLEAAAECEVA